MRSSASPLIEVRGVRQRRRIEEVEAEFWNPLTVKLVLRRTILGLSQEELNHIVGCADNHLAKWEAGIWRPSAYYLVLWCKALGYRLDVRDT